MVCGPFETILWVVLNCVINHLVCWWPGHFGSAGLQCVQSMGQIMTLHLMPNIVMLIFRSRDDRKSFFPQKNETPRSFSNMIWMMTDILISRVLNFIQLFVLSGVLTCETHLIPLCRLNESENGILFYILNMWVQTRSRPSSSHADVLTGVLGVLPGRLRCPCATPKASPTKPHATCVVTHRVCVTLIRFGHKTSVIFGHFQAKTT